MNRRSVIMAYQIGSFSRITQLSVKTLRYYHEEGLLIPVKIDAQSGYRYYDAANLEKAMMIKTLRELEFGIDEIREITNQCKKDKDVYNYLKLKQKEIDMRIKNNIKLKRKLKIFIEYSKGDTRVMTDYDINVKNIESQLMASIRFKGYYHEVGKAFGTIFRVAGRYCNGNPFSLYYDKEYKEKEADIEACVPVRKEISHPGVVCRQLEAAKVISLMHKGSYEQLGRSYKKVFDYVNDKQLEMLSPSREIYVKGPGMFFRGNPKKYITEIQIAVK